MKIMIQVIILVLISAAALCGYFFARSYIVANEEMSEFSDLRSRYTKTTEPPPCESGDFTVTPATEVLPLIEVDFEALLSINPDTVGWIMIPGTVISYPVVQTVNNVKYLNTSFEGNHSRAGTPFANSNNDMRGLDRNTIIYGHNMGMGRSDMFSTLLMYKDYDYFTANRSIRFDTIYRQHGFWEVFAVIHLDDRYRGFNNQQIGFQDETEFLEWIGQAMGLSMHGTDMVVSEGAYILTLSTCDRSRHGRYGRLLILAVRMFDNE